MPQAVHAQDCDSALVSMRLTVSATRGWQNTNVPIAKLRGIEYLDGLWTVNRRNVRTIDPWVDADGYDRAANSDNAFPGERNGALIGRGTKGGMFLVGNYYSGIPDAYGNLQLAINDAHLPTHGEALGDNAGAVNVLVWYCQ
jgi:hypothetical protein